MKSIKFSGSALLFVAALFLSSCSKEVAQDPTDNEMGASALVLKPDQASENKVVWTQVVRMDAMQANSNSQSFGVAIFRLSSDMKLTYKFIVQNIDDGDLLHNAHIHPGAPGVNGPAVIGMQPGVMNLNEFQTLQLTTTQYDLLVNSNQPLYVNIHTQYYPQNSIRGQIR